MPSLLDTPHLYYACGLLYKQGNQGHFHRLLRAAKSDHKNKINAAALAVFPMTYSSSILKEKRGLYLMKEYNNAIVVNKAKIVDLCTFLF